MDPSHALSFQRMFQAQTRPIELERTNGFYWEIKKGICKILPVLQETKCQILFQQDFIFFFSPVTFRTSSGSKSEGIHLSLWWQMDTLCIHSSISYFFNILLLTLSPLPLFRVSHSVLKFLRRGELRGITIFFIF